MNRKSESASSSKDTIYVDIDDEITAIIDKVTASKNKIVALVLPKRATAMQSIVNMKLLKRSADEKDKNVVLITTEAGLLPLAGAVGLHVAATPQSKPVIPHAPANVSDESDEEVEEGTSFDLHENSAKPIGALAGDEPVDETIQLDNGEDTDEVAPVPSGSRRTGAAAAAGAALAKAKKGKNKKLKIPDFNKFRTRLVLGVVALLLLIGLWVLAAVVLPKATVAIKTDSEDVDLTLDVTFDTKAAGVDEETSVVPARVQQEQKTTTQTVNASGQRNEGEKAQGSITMTICASNPAEVRDVPSGTGVSSGGNNYITQETAQFNYKGGCGGGFRFTSQKVNIVSQEGGAKYNVNDATFTVAGSSSTATGSADGGTDNIIKVIAQSDINSAKEKLSAQTDESVKEELIQKLDDEGLFVIEESFNAGTPEVSASAKAGDQVESVTVTQKTTYSVVAAEKSDIDALITANVENEIDTNKQKVLNTGLDEAVFKLQNQQDNSSKVLMSMDVTALAGPKLDDEAIKTQIAGKKANDAKEILTNYPGVTDVTVKYSPFWVSSIPKSTDKITITYEK